MHKAILNIIDDVMIESVLRVWITS